MGRVPSCSTRPDPTDPEVDNVGAAVSSWRPVIAVNDRGLILGRDSGGAWVVWNRDNAAGLARDHLLWLLPLLERPHDVITPALASAGDDEPLLPALLRFALASDSEYWAGSALGWLETGFP